MSFTAIHGSHKDVNRATNTIVVIEGDVLKAKCCVAVDNLRSRTMETRLSDLALDDYEKGSYFSKMP